MGIKFYCHACSKRLNVKEFLAGKRGICPHCSAKVDIPWQSEGSPSAQPAGAVPHSVAAGNGSSNGAAVAARSTAPATAATVAQAVPMAAAPAASAPAATSPANTAPASTAAPFVTAAPVQATPVVPVPAAPVPAAPADPIDEAPAAVWYVRPPSGGQFGPASGEIMRRWLAEGRVSADSLIWREGWADWKNAGAQFAELGGGPAAASPTAARSTPPQPAAHTPALSADTPAPGRTYPRRQKNNSLAVILVVLLTLASLGLFGVLIAVINFMQ